MGMPQIPEGKNRPSAEDTIIDLLESIALEEMAISHILNAEGEKLQAIVGKFQCKEICVNTMIDASKSINRTVLDLIMKEWLLISKFNNISDFTEKYIKEKDIFKREKEESFNVERCACGECQKVRDMCNNCDRFKV